MLEKPEKPIRVRMAPSPTGRLHIGTARAALFNVLFAKHNKGTFILRIEDTDKERSKKEFEDELVEGFSWLGIVWDEGPLPGGGEKGEYGPYRQSERTEIYKKYINELLAAGHAYYCYCTKEDLEAQKQEMSAAGLAPKYNGHCRPENSGTQEAASGKIPQVIRFKIPEVEVSFKDIIRGHVSFDASLFGDIAIAKDLETPLHHLAVVVDDELMNVSHVIRGEDLLSNTPRQILIQRALGFSEPIYGHLPLILNPDRSKMSKRFSATALLEYQSRGYLPKAMVNFLAFIGWHPHDGKEILSIDELASEFDIDRVQKAGAIFNQDKLDWLNREYIKTTPDDELVSMLTPFFKEEGTNADQEHIKNILSLERTRATTLREFVANTRFIFKLPEYDPQLLVWKETPKETVGPILAMLSEKLSAIQGSDFSRDKIKNAIESCVGEHKKGEIFWPLRVALSGAASSPDPIDIMTVLGKEESLARIARAIRTINA
jgi:glutamyl-tRNA synthetase